MGFLSRRKERPAPVVEVAPPDDTAPERRAREEVWNREIDRLGRAEVLQRLAALSDYRSGRTGPSGFENWNREIEREITQLANQIAAKPPE